MKVFLSWSGHKSHEVAKTLKEWIPSVIQSISPYVSSEDIDKGTRWSTDIAKELEDSSFGILCVTKENLEEPWLLFEAGALSKMIDKSSVCPFLFDLKMAEIKEGPILQFQSTVFDKEDIKKLIKTLNKTCGESGLKDDLLTKSFEVWWPKLKEELDKIKDLKDLEDKNNSTRPQRNDMLEEILELSRMNQKLLRSPEILFPREYLDRISNKCNDNYTGRELFTSNMFKEISMELHHTIIKAKDMLEIYKTENKVVDEELYINLRRMIDLAYRQNMYIRKCNFRTR